MAQAVDGALEVCVVLVDPGGAGEERCVPLCVVWVPGLAACAVCVWDEGNHSVVCVSPLECLFQCAGFV